MNIFNWEQLFSFLSIPNVLLVSLLSLMMMVFYKSMKSPGFDISDMLREDSGKASSSRVAIFIALCVSSYMLVYITVNKTVTDEYLFYIYSVYILAWASSKTLDKAVGAWFYSRTGESFARNRNSSTDYSQNNPPPNYGPGSGNNDYGSQYQQPTYTPGNQPPATESYERPVRHP